MPPKASVMERSSLKSTPLFRRYVMAFFSPWSHDDTQSTVTPSCWRRSTAYCATLPKPCTLAVVFSGFIFSSRMASRIVKTTP